MLGLGENKCLLSVSVTYVFISVLSIVFAKSLRVFDEVQRYFVFLFSISVLMESKKLSCRTLWDELKTLSFVYTDSNKISVPKK